MTATTRQLKVGRLLQKELGIIFQQDKKGMLNQHFITVAEVKISPDLSVAKVYISMMLTENKNQILAILNRNKPEIRKTLGAKIRNQVRIVPEVIFYIDEVEENALRLENIINNLNIPPATKDEEE